MSAYIPTKKVVPYWMRLNDTRAKHWMSSGDLDMEISGIDSGGMTEANLADGLSELEIYRLRGSCYWDDSWELNHKQKESRSCDTAAMKYPEANLRHVACYKSIKNAYMGANVEESKLRGCSMYSLISGKIFPEYEKCLKPGGMDDLDCQRTCYTYPNQKGCETLTAGLDRTQLHKKLREIEKGPKPDEIPPPPPPVPEETVVIAASMKSVTPTAVQFSYVDPKTKKSVIVKKTLVDMYKPTDKVTVVLGKKTNKFVDLRKK